MPTPDNVRFFESAEDLRDWLVKNHNAADELWVGLYKKGSGRQTISWQDLVDQELCFGWIDSVGKSLDEHRRAQRITPRRKRSIWSVVNIKRFGELDAMGLVAPAGRAAFEARDEARSGVYAYENSSELDESMLAKLQRNKRAWKFFESEAPWYRRNAAHWVVSAKREETRERRLSVLIECSKDGVRIPHLRQP